MGLAYSMSKVKILILDNKVWQFIGRKSYGIYLSHYLLMLMTEKIDIFRESTNLVVWMIKYILILFLSILTTIFWEKIESSVKQTICGRI
jgi:peptidoglycan/LPS O-acetylase OafA/YrhL